MLKVQNVSYQYDSNNKVLDNINFTIQAGEIVCLLGESGSGKTTLLRAIAGLENDYQGQIIYDGQAIKDIPIHQRGFGLMFQDFALFPHMTVAQNVAFGLKMQGISAQEQKHLIDEMLDLVGLGGYQNRNIDALSGGQKQRVALARSLAPRPSLLMLDEPLGSLDAGLRERLVLELRQIIKQIGLTAIYVTHDQQEAFAIADRIAIMNKGRIEQFDTPEQLYRHPRTTFTAEFLGLSNIVSTEFLSKHVDIALSAQKYLIHPDSIMVEADGQIYAKVVERIFQGEHYRLKVLVDDTVELSFKIPSSTTMSNKAETICFNLNPDRIQPLEP